MKQAIYNKDKKTWHCPYWLTEECDDSLSIDCKGYACCDKDRSKVFPPIPKHIKQWQDKLNAI